MTFKMTTPTTSSSSDGDVTADTKGDIPYSEISLANGLRVILHPDHSVPVVNINVLYRVGSKDEDPGRTGFAHLFEHLMFDGSRNVPRGDYDRYCTMVGGDNNAFTTCDLTDYHITLPREHLPLGLWLESDRMSGFAVGPDSLETQKSVVIEEKKQTQDDVPYGEASMVMRELSYGPTHPYSWDTIGSVEDIQGATMEDVQTFYERYYVPSRAILTVAGDFRSDETMGLIEGYFGDIAAGRSAASGPSVNRVGAEEERTGGRRCISRDILPFNALFMGWHVPPIGCRDLRAVDILTDVLAEGESSRLYRTLEYTMQIASETDAFVDEGELDSMLYVYAVAQHGNVENRRLEESMRKEIERISCEGITEVELQKVINRKTTRIAHALQSISNRAERLAWFSALYNDPMLAFREGDLYASITLDDIQRVASEYLTAVEPNIIEYILPQ